MNAERALAEIANMNDPESGNSALDGDELLEAATALADEVQRLRELNEHATSERVRLAQQVERLATAGRGVEAKLSAIAELPEHWRALRHADYDEPADDLASLLRGEP